MLEAGVIGDNASGRNSGFAIDLPHAPDTSAAQTAQGLRAIRVGRQVLDTLGTLIAEHGIDCDWSAAGRYHAVASASMVGALDVYEANLRAWGEPFERCDRGALRERLGTDYYHGAIYTPGTFLMNPAALVCGLALSGWPQDTGAGRQACPGSRV